MKRDRRHIKKITKNNREEYVIIGGDFNRIGELDNIGDGGEKNWRRSKDKIMGKEKLVELVERMGRYILNGTDIEDREEEFTYVGARGCSVIDYVITNEVGYEIVKNFRIGERNSDHIPNPIIALGAGAEK